MLCLPKVNLTWCLECQYFCVAASALPSHLVPAMSILLYYILDKSVVGVAGVSDALPCTKLKDLDELTGSVEVHRGLVELHFHSDRATITIGAAVAIGDSTEGDVLLQCWASKQLVFPELRNNG